MDEFRWGPGTIFEEVGDANPHVLGTTNFPEISGLQGDSISQWQATSFDDRLLKHGIDATTQVSEVHFR